MPVTIVVPAVPQAVALPVPGVEVHVVEVRGQGRQIVGVGGRFVPLVEAVGDPPRLPLVLMSVEPPNYPAASDPTTARTRVSLTAQGVALPEFAATRQTSIMAGSSR